MSSVITKLRCYYITISRMTLLQITWRIRAIILQRLWRLQTRALPTCTSREICGETLPRFGCISPGKKEQSVIQRAEAICQGRFSFLNQSINFEGNLPNWSASPDGDRLWTYTLHYFDYAYDLLWAYRVTKQTLYLDCLIDLINDWISKDLQWSPIAWNPYPLSKRVIAWTTLLGHLNTDIRFQPHLDQIVSSLCQQVTFLFRNLEYDVDNNHLITNARALVWAALFLPGHKEAAKWYQKGIDILEREAKRQILTDGGHWERSTSYQMVVLQDYLETTLLLQKLDRQVPAGFRSTVTQMYNFVGGIMKPDGTLPLLNDSVEGYPVSIADIMAVGAVYLERPELKAGIKESPSIYLDWLLGEEGRRKFESLPDLSLNSQSTAFNESGYYVLRAAEDGYQQYLIFDCGSIGPRHSAAHAHADTLSFELFAYNQTLIIDPGVYEYKAGQWRDYFRSTAAHNTVMVDGLDQSIFWSSFRVAEMAQAKLINWETSTEYDYVEGEHNGYTRFKNGVIHRRSIRYDKPNQWTITDTLYNQKQGFHYYDLRFHLTPSACTLDPETGICLAHFPKGVILTVKPEHPAETIAQVEREWLSYTWKQKISAPVLNYHLKSMAAKIVFKTTLSVSLQADQEQ